jgi:pimeloyl-ACP methyl ester carboxylesterase
MVKNIRKLPQPEILIQSIGDADLRYLSYDGDGPPMIFLHATGFFPWLWHPIARELTPAYRIIAPYFCDHRESDPEKGGLNWVILARDLASFCKVLSIENPFLVGHSMGATVSTMASTLFGLKAKGIILIEPIFLPQVLYTLSLKVEDHPLASKAVKRTNGWSDTEEAFVYLKSRNFFKNWDKEMLEIYINHGMVPGETGGLQLACSPRKEASLFMGGLQYDPWPLLPEISCPTLILEGETSENRLYIDLKKVMSLIPHASYMLINHSGHLIPMEKPKELTNIIKNFLLQTKKANPSQLKH